MFLDNDECNWDVGVSCDKEQNVDTIDLNGRNLAGGLSADLGLMSNLVYFSVSDNALTGSLPFSIGMWTNLMTF